MNAGDQRPDPYGRNQPPGDAPQFTAPSGPYGGNYAGTGPAGPYGTGQRPAFDPTVPMTGPGSPSDPTGGPPGGRPPERPQNSFRPRRRLAPTLITVGVLVLAVIVIGGGVLISRYRDAHASAEPTPGASAPAGPTTPTPSTGASTPGSGGTTAAATNSIAFTSSDASGTLSIVGHQWTTQGNPDPSNDYYLAVEIQIQVAKGSMYYSSDTFEAFDATGNVYGAGENVYQQPLLSTGQVTAGQAVRGWIDFDLQRGATTVLMIGPDDQPVAALKVEG